jgi:hypothetical protein
MPSGPSAERLFHQKYTVDRVKQSIEAVFTAGALSLKRRATLTMIE